MSDKKLGIGFPVPRQASEAVVAFYLTQETELPAVFQGEHQVVKIKIASSLGKPVESLH